MQTGLRKWFKLNRLKGGSSLFFLMLEEQVKLRLFLSANKIYTVAG
jgi:hypothetical protein